MRDDKLHPDMRALLDAQSVTYGSSIQDERKSWNEYARKIGRPVPPHITTEDREIATADFAVPVRIYRKPGSGNTGCVIYMHGGGWTKGDVDSSDSMAWGLCDVSNAVVISVGYRLAPEHVFPAAFNDSYGVLEWAHANAKELGIDTNKIVLAGDSAGGNLTAALSIASRDDGGPKVAAQVVIYPGIGEYIESDSYRANATGYGLTTDRYRFYCKQYLGGSFDIDDVRARPMLAKDFSSLPPAYVVTAEFDPIRDDGRMYAMRLVEAGNDCIYRECRGLIHGFFRARFISQVAADELDRIGEFMRPFVS
ncbi:MAG: alpha/beta hydrolase [Candidimonas sp.]